MARGRGFLAEIQHQARVAAREAERQKQRAVRDHNAALRKAEQQRKAAERANAQASRAAAAERKRLEKEAKTAHVAAMESQVEEKNAELQQVFEEIDNLLAATLDVDDYVDLDTLHQEVEHPPFDREDLEKPIPRPPEIADPPEPVFVPPDPPKTLFGKKKKHARAIDQAKIAHSRKHTAWQEKVRRNASEGAEAAALYSKTEQRRVETLKIEKQRYEAECKKREAQVLEFNNRIEKLKVDLGYGTTEAIQEYVSIVLANSVYPAHFQVEHEFSFDSSSAELSLRVLIPPPTDLPTTKAFKYTKSTDEISETSLSQKACKDRYSEAVCQVALRSFHEVFEADRRGLIKSISLEVGTETTNPATGQHDFILFLAGAAEREKFLSFDLSSVVPSATLAHIGAAVSKNAFGLVEVDRTGVRRS